ncbi:MAG: hypothetical protein HYT08_02635 [Candidatus Levybacteria bacterium]|nr:hypothetical protein [Candidatus Levybacteria bacterium]
MSDENINPQNIPIASPDPSLTNPKSPFLNSKKIALLLFLFVLIIFGSLSFWFLSQTKQTPPKPIPNVTPTAVPIPTQGTNELILILKLKETITIPDTQISITYASADIPGENCYDCVTSNVLEIAMNGEKKILDYSCGGITGKCITKQEAYGYEIEIIDNPAKDMLKLKIIKK